MFYHNYYIRKLSPASSAGNSMAETAELYIVDWVSGKLCRDKWNEGNKVACGGEPIMN